MHLLPGFVEQFLTIVPALIVAGIALRCRRYWSMRFWLAAAILYWLIPTAITAIFNASNGSGIRRPPSAWLTIPISALGIVSVPLLFILMALGLLSFHPATRWVDTARHRNTTLIAVLLVMMGVLGYLGWKESQGRKIPPLDPINTFYPKRPLATALTVQLEPIQEIFVENEPQFRMTLTNHSDADIHLNGLPFGRFQFHPSPYLTQRRDDGREFAWGTELKFPQDHEVLAPGTSRTVLFPENTRELWLSNSHEEDEGISYRMTAGSYAAYVSFWLREKGRSQRVLSNVVQFRCKPSKPRP